MQTLTLPGIPGFHASVHPHHYDDMRAKLIKCTGKTRASKPKAEKRNFPIHGAAMDTASYVALYYQINDGVLRTADHRTIYEPLSTRRQEWPSEPLEEPLDETEGVSSQLTIEGSEGLPVWLTAGIPPDWLRQSS